MSKTFQIRRLSGLRTPEDFKAWSQNLGHGQVLTTFFSYGEVATQRQGGIIQNVKDPTQNDGQNDFDKFAEAAMKKMQGLGMVSPNSRT